MSIRKANAATLKPTPRLCSDKWYTPIPEGNDGNTIESNEQISFPQNVSGFRQRKRSTTWYGT